MSKIVKILSFILSLLVANRGYASADNANTIISEEQEVYNYAHYTTDEGLSSNNVNVIHSCKSGQLWIGTDDGLNAFDGYEFKEYTPDANNMANTCGKTIYDIKEYVDNNIIIATADKGVSEYNKNTDKFITPNLGIDLGENYKINNAYGICKVKNRLYFKFDKFILEYNKDSKEKRTFDLPTHDITEGISLKKAKMVTQPDSINIAIILNRSAIAILNPLYGSIKEISFPNDFFIYDICAIDKNKFYIASSKGLYVYYVSEHSLEQCNILIDKNVHAIHRNKCGDFWIAYNNTEIIKWIPNENKLIKITTSTQILNAQTFINDIFEDENNILWIATSNCGIIKIDTKISKIITHDIAVELPSNYKTTDLCVANSETIWAACSTDGIVRIDTKTNTGEHINVASSNVLSILARRNGEILLGTTSGLKKYDSNTNSENWQSIPFPNQQSFSSFKKISVYCMIEDCLGNIWLGTQSGLFRYNGYYIEHAFSESGFKAINVLYEDNDGCIWAGTDDGSYLKKPQSDTFIRINDCEELKEALPTPKCYNDFGNKILIGTTSGVLLFNKENMTTEFASFNNNFRNSIVYSIISEPNGIIWLSTNKGIGYIDTNFEQIMLFNNLDGLNYIGNECRKFTKYGDNIYFGNATQLNVINANHIQFNTTVPKTFINEIKYGQIDNERNAKMINDSVYYTKFLLRASLTIKIASSDFSIPSRNEFMYKIDDDEWHILHNSNKISLSGLSPGTYAIQIRCSNSDKTWSDQTIKIFIEIEPPLWGSTPAIIFYGVMLLIIIWLLLDLRFRNINKKMKQMESEARAKKVVEAQRNRLAVIHKAQTDSINYAKRIQDSIIPKESTIQKHFNKLFVLFRPKDIVSGDFYSFYQRNDKTFIIAADCTGHGVPGAFLSILGLDHLFNIIMKQNVDDAGTILTTLHRELHETIFSNDAQFNEFNDGMDLTISVINHKDKTISFAGAMNDMYLIRDNEITTFRGNRHSIGTNLSVDSNDDSTIYDSQIIKCQPGDIFYMFSDGFADQFGGPEQQKFKYRRFKHLLLNIHKLPARDQRIVLNQKLDEWRGTNEQTDDISVIGFEPWA